MRHRGLDVLDRRKLLRHKQRDLLQRGPLDLHQEVIASRKEVHRGNLRKTINGLRYRVESDAALGRDLHLDQGMHFIVADPLPVDVGFIPQNDPFFLELRDIFFHLRFGNIQLERNIRWRRFIGGEYFKNGVARFTVYMV